METMPEIINTRLWTRIIQQYEKNKMQFSLTIRKGQLDVI